MYVIHCKTCGTKSAKSYIYKKTALNQLDKGIWKRHKDKGCDIEVESFMKA